MIKTELGDVNDRLVKLVEETAMWTIIENDTPYLERMQQGKRDVARACNEYGVPAQGYVELYQRKLDQIASPE